MYLLSVLAQDEETQRKGCVWVLLNIKPLVSPGERADAVHFTNLMVNLGPIRHVGIHFCYDAPQQTMISNLEALLSSANQFSCVRFRIHSGRSIKELAGLGALLGLPLYEY
jgi:hypothetical protein